MRDGGRRAVNVAHPWRERRGPIELWKLRRRHAGVIRKARADLELRLLRDMARTPRCWARATVTCSRRLGRAGYRSCACEWVNESKISSGSPRPGHDAAPAPS